ncbi:MAG: polymerase, sigma 70 subunit, RpoD family [Deltaproteobacteria bacterium]|nr:polymerase, sigma 70 subunit, RpoD family [Deltaproteobacteria bacterium]
MAKKTDIEDLKRLISMGKEKGYLTYDEVNDALPDELVDSEKLDDMMMIFDEMDIAIVDTSQKVKVLKEKIEKEAGTIEEEEDELRLEEDDQGGRVTDPVKMYLREMGMVCLLTREGEVEIAKRIEQGEQEVIDAIIATPVGVREILGLREKIAQNRLRIRDVLKHLDEELSSEEEAREQAKLLCLLEEVQGLDEGNRQLEEQTQSALDKAERHARDELTRANKEKISHLLKNLRLEKRQIDRIVSKLRHCVERIEKGEEEIGQCMLRTGKPLQELRRYGWSRKRRWMPVPSNRYFAR